LQTKNYTLPHQVNTTRACLFLGCSLANSHTPANQKHRYRQKLKTGASGQQHDETKHQNIISRMQHLALSSLCSW